MRTICSINQVSPETAASFASPAVAEALMRMTDLAARHTWVLQVDGLGVLAVGGIFISRPGFGECWIGLNPKTKLGYKAAKALLVGSLEFLNHMAQIHGLNRVQCTSVKGDDRALRFASALGFEVEGELRCYDQEFQTHLLHAKIYA